MILTNLHVVEAHQTMLHLIYEPLLFPVPVVELVTALCSLSFHASVSQLNRPLPVFAVHDTPDLKVLKQQYANNQHFISSSILQHHLIPRTYIYSYE